MVVLEMGDSKFNHESLEVPNFKSHHPSNVTMVQRFNLDLPGLPACSCRGVSSFPPGHLPTQMG